MGILCDWTKSIPSKVPRVPPNPAHAASHRFEWLQEGWKEHMIPPTQMCPMYFSRSLGNMSLTSLHNLNLKCNQSQNLRGSSRAIISFDLKPKRYLHYIKKKIKNKKPYPAWGTKANTHTHFTSPHCCKAQWVGWLSTNQCFDRSANKCMCTLDKVYFSWKIFKMTSPTPLQ